MLMNEVVVVELLIRRFEEASQVARADSTHLSKGETKFDIKNSK
jgi:hypothetical protein